MKPVLIVEDDKDIQRLLSTCFEQEALPYSITSSGLEAVELVKKTSPSLILLDIMLPDSDGMEICQQIRMLTSSPIMFLSCKNKDTDKILGFSLGADDYVEKPFNIGVLMARVRAHLRRSRLLQQQQQQHEDHQIRFDNICINVHSREVFRDKRVISLTAKEFDLLCFFVRHPNRVFTSEQLLDSVWGTDTLSEKRTVVVHISSLRRSIEENALQPRYIVTVRGVGYKFAAV
ncbi:response regulator transcription factor [Aneurinibacillus aneurinilyticus]|jgi:DNA-binding response OmpR family regulator|uniref:Response regulator transcription factor n=2 Tax=Aneurinibacillus aneurinilyticus TaxID=1391 RepID=A0A848CYP8_ANEAE|nr:response regulator transcription factor [Aneurinibacillus aneurinilyticus]ERI07629.1 response regulator receiver domain protein [Aneurinibacillus aneurinilyticus ATCC 12856]MCI1692730.1 response regulator transcription factor [Aneurinibacillus aneurinilyticus]MED0668764.1 response regulator transcription factor [Aneurinibacillus aneurinilyticus]MED0707218.1 response regulator transcription factor [Aneurinibacillus aneurinilyticus]MED0722045.1 response regulator transcription factor [Aneurin